MSQHLTLCDTASFTPSTQAAKIQFFFLTQTLLIVASILILSTFMVPHTLCRTCLCEGRLLKPLNTLSQLVFFLFVSFDSRKSITWCLDSVKSHDNSNHGNGVKEPIGTRVEAANRLTRELQNDRLFLLLPPKSTTQRNRKKKENRSVILRHSYRICHYWLCSFWELIEHPAINEIKPLGANHTLEIYVWPWEKLLEWIRKSTTRQAQAV